MRSASVDNLRIEVPDAPVESGDDEEKKEVEVGLLSHLKYGDLIGSAVVGFLTGFLGSMAGVGGGPFCVPLLAWLLGLGHKRCVGTSILCGLTTLTVGGITTFLSASNLVIPLIPIAVLATVAPVFGYFSAKMSSRISPTILKQIFAVALLVCALQIVWNLLYSPTGVEGHWSYTLHGKQLTYEIESVEGVLVFRTAHFSGGLFPAGAEGKVGEAPEGFERGWFTPMRTGEEVKGVMWIRVLDRGSSMETIYQSLLPVAHWNERVAATRKKSAISAFFATVVASDTGNAIFHFGIAFIAGTCSGLLGIAGGSVVVPLMSLSGAFKWQVITTTSLLSMIPTSLTTCYTHHLNGNVALRLAPGLVTGTIIGAFTGSRLMAFTTEIVRKSACAGILLFTACIMLYQGLKPYVTNIQDKAALIKTGAAAIFFFCLAALLQEKVFNLPDFSHEYLLTFLQSVVMCMFSFLDLKKTGNHNPLDEIPSPVNKKLERRCPLAVYVILAILVTAGGVCTHKASKLLDYTTQVVFKSAKLPWLMVWRVVLLSWKRRPGLKEWLCAAGLSIGLAIFVSAAAGSRGDLGMNYWSGLLSILVALACDATVYTIEEGVVFYKYKADKLELIMYLSGLTVPVSFLALLQSGSLSTSWIFLQREWRFPTLVLSYAACTYIGTRYIVQIVQEFDSTMAVVTTSLRKVFTVILSYAFFPKAFTSLHLLGLILVFSCTYGQIKYAEFPAPPDQREDKESIPGTPPMQLQSHGLMHD
eukprot:TRINITY_DN23522_c0_g1_i1.p1 TRINITY_DN23522_c0_g1~~TRINITY_DN23522_c0_g1_i1.p1  ORF type:complete len:757 (+),score=93.68 TRINITY_DN23522_c0_g1_i1:64-2334(+)